ncbi:MAG: GNAT family N-acetyltransferase [Xanthobacteraceae bacterium]|nr:GNAT family N-acetyltransferase [Xanthobacteraceae bacterium]
MRGDTNVDPAKTCRQDMPPRHAAKTCRQDIPPRHPTKTSGQEMGHYAGASEVRVMPPSLTVRTALPSDADALAAYIAAIVAERLPVLFARDAPPTVEQVARMIARHADDARSALFVAVEKGAILGMLDFSGHARPQQHHVGSFGMSVARAARGRGVGTRLLRPLYAHAKKHGYRKLELEVFATNGPAIVLYESHGFVHEGRRRGAVMVGEEPVDLLLMGKGV